MLKITKGNYWTMRETLLQHWIDCLDFRRNGFARGTIRRKKVLVLHRMLLRNKNLKQLEQYINNYLEK